MATRPALLPQYYRQYAPDTFKILAKIQPSIDQPDFSEVLNKEYPKLEKISVDYGLFEKLPPKPNGNCRPIWVGLTLALGNCFTTVCRKTKTIMW